MKVSSIHRPRSGFTLIELLVVIAIIAVLAGAGFAVGSAALNRARKVSAEATATSLDQAVNMFFSEYGTFPIPSGGSGTLNTGSDTTFLNALIGQDQELNPRGIRFLSVKEGEIDGDGGRNGLVFSGDSIRGLYDPWGNPYTVVLDTDYREVLEFTPANIQGSQPVRLNGRRVAVYSRGVPIGETANRSDMVKTW